MSSPQGRFPGAKPLDGRTLHGTDAVGKHLFYDFGDGDWVHVHLGLFGKYFHHDSPPPPPRDTVRMRLQTNEHTVDLVGAVACELLTPGERDAIVDRMGPDPLRDDADPERGWQALQRKRVGIGRALLDQSVIAGVGNVYRAEVLFVHGIHPEAPSQSITREQWEDIWSTLAEWMRRGVEERRIITMDPKELGKPRSRMRRAESRYVYKIEQCHRCGDVIRRWDLSGRWAYACETCQQTVQPSQARVASQNT